jgi:hypothetical protein
MRKHYRQMFAVFWKDFKSSTGEQVIGALLAIGIFLFQLWYGLIKPGEVRANFWAIASPYVLLVVCLSFWHLIRAPWKLHEQNVQSHDEIKASLLTDVHREKESRSQAETRTQELLNLKPNLNCRFDYGGQEAALSITNGGAIAEVWASLRIKGPVSGRTSDIFSRWAHPNAGKISIAKGETYRLLLASLKTGSGYMATWEIPYAWHTGWASTCSLYTSLIGNKDAQAADIHLYVGLFSNPDCVQLTGERHVVLHASSAEELGN